jgi:hypothetical protein
MAERYVHTSDGYVAVTPRYEPALRRFTIRQRGGRLVIEEV